MLHAEHRPGKDACLTNSATTTTDGEATAAQKLNDAVEQIYSDLPDDDTNTA